MILANAIKTIYHTYQYKRYNTSRGPKWTHKIT